MYMYILSNCRKYKLVMISISILMQHFKKTVN